MIQYLQRAGKAPTEDSEMEDRAAEIRTAFMLVRHRREAVTKGAARVTEALRRLADDIERDVNSGLDRMDAPEYPTTAVKMVAEIQNAISWKVANLMLPSLITDAAEWDAVRAQLSSLDPTDEELAELIKRYS